ncbi:MAG: hypothetical protein R2688_10360 [Fimbriimonadaceae bacterium]
MNPRSDSPMIGRLPRCFPSGATSLAATNARRHRLQPADTPPIRTNLDGAFHRNAAPFLDYRIIEAAWLSPNDSKSIAGLENGRSAIW